MKWLKKHRDDIVDGVKFFIMMDTMVFGFWWNYMWVWYLLGFPLEWWSIVIAMALALLSLFGFCQWVTKG
jgi:hypothetical protein